MNLTHIICLGRAKIEGKALFLNDVECLSKVRLGNRAEGTTANYYMSYSGGTTKSIDFYAGTLAMQIRTDNVDIHKNLNVNMGITFPLEQYWTGGVTTQAFKGLNMNNTDIIGLNSLIWKDSCNGNEGIWMPKTDTVVANSQTVADYHIFKMYNSLMYFDAWTFADVSTRTIHANKINFLSAAATDLAYIECNYETGAESTKFDFVLGDNPGTTVTDEMRWRFKPSGITDPFTMMSLNAISNTKANLTINGDLTADKVHNAVWNDYAEYFEKPEEAIFEPGDVICSDDDTDNYVLSTSAYQKSVIGVYSDTYGHIVGGTKDEEYNKEHFSPIGLAGRVDVKVIGKVSKGDLITTSDIPGVAMKADMYVPGTVIGKAVQNKDTDELGKVKIFIMNI